MSAIFHEHIRHWCAGAAALVCAFLAPPPAQSQVTDDMIAGSATSVDNVLTVGMGQAGQRFSPLTLINAANIGDLVPAWTFSFGGEKQRGQETQPLVYNGKIFVTGSYSRIWALDARTGPGCGPMNTGCPTASSLAATWSIGARLCTAIWSSSAPWTRTSWPESGHGQGRVE